MSSATHKPLQWIGGRAFDLTVFFGSSVFAVAVALVVMAQPSLVVPLWWAWIFLVDGPHLFATLLRTYLDPDEWTRHRQLFWSSLLWISPGFVAFVATKLSGNRMPYDLFLLFASLWAYHHAVRQHWGILAIYERLAGAEQRSGETRRKELASVLPRAVQQQNSIIDLALSVAVGLTEGLIVQSQRQHRLPVVEGKAAHLEDFGRRRPRLVRRSQGIRRAESCRR